MVEHFKDAHQLYQEALRLFKAYKYEESTHLLEESLTLEPRHANALEALGVIYGKLNRLDEAIQLMKRLAEIDPDHVMAHTNLSQFYVRKGMIQEAEAEQAEARRLSWKAELRAQNKTESEINALTQAEEEKEKESALRKIEQYRKVIDFDPNDVLGYFSLGSAYAQAKQFEDSMNAFKKAIEVDPKHSPSYVGLGEAFEALGKKEEALQIYKQGIPVADDRGDIVPLRKMENRVRKLTQSAS
ncbi:MAG: hypothetical protein COV74_10375 [Candidatus Omnitrophica bacterium CG11_big_fil_rev_8_21_14_0_20_45_26]|uniref:Uncharacterized protein n=1 Tax=Candidatus Abzuiibacterium crystallinum TaxID=1974748 RepID=A0A2H0LKX3_9BACT|nr:MAG: hypothetical protein COV74_10375 [Candidatus Omnitrophica bacterium CG11_big_fil_rev_8_21_14_0_20_45_26]PIW63926.1 MAG: hypothetical protein COW12_08445 [Candidatus Omnitrophica bacterium CG12_big_fil_rev_8_21_14_0_65_45_16]